MKLTRRQFLQATGLSAIAAALGLTAPREPTPEPEPQAEAPKKAEPLYPITATSSATFSNVDRWYNYTGR